MSHTQMFSVQILLVLCVLTISLSVNSSENPSFQGSSFESNKENDAIALEITDPLIAPKPLLPIPIPDSITDFPPPDQSDAYLGAPELIRKNGYPLEIHEVVTVDGYILGLHRIPQPGATPIVLMHGILCSSRDWLMQRGNNSIAYLLYNAGYDVWLGNMRGNTYSQGHTTYLKNDSRYWDFSVDEISDIDVPNTIDYVLNVTGRTELAYIGYSLGTTTLFAGLIQQPEYQSKISCFIGLAPVAFKGHCRSPLVRIMADLALPEQPIRRILEKPSGGQFLAEHVTKLMFATMPHLCHPGIDFPDLCGTFMSLVGGFNPTQSDQYMQPIIMGEFPSPTSVRVYVQQLQHVFIGGGKFRRYFYQDRKINLEKYSSVLPPELDLTTFRVPTFFYAGLNDYLAPPEDVKMLAQLLPMLLEVHNITDPTWNHLDFLYGKQARELVYELLIERLLTCSPP